MYAFDSEEKVSITRHSQSQTLKHIQQIVPGPE
jgi:hypothetical protein